MPEPSRDVRRRAATVDAVGDVDGWLRTAQAEMLWDLAVDLPTASTIVEIGSYHGKSTVVLATAAPDGSRVHAIDPHAGNDRGPGQWAGTAAEGEADHQAFLRTLRQHGVADRVVHVRKRSDEALDDVSGPIDLLYVDGAHGYRPALGDLTDWGDRVRPRGTMVVHDVYNSFFVSLAIMRRVWFSRHWRRVARTTSMAAYERCELTGAARLRSIGSNVGELPVFVRNMVIKGLTYLGAERAATLLGHETGSGLY